MKKHRPIHKLTYMHTHAYVFMHVYAHAYTWGPCISLLLSPPVTSSLHRIRREEMLHLLALQLINS